MLKLYKTKHQIADLIIEASDWKIYRKILEFALEDCKHELKRPKR